MNQFFIILSIGLAGALGALVRYGTSVLSKQLFGDGFPIATLVVNVAGCFLLGMLAHLGSQQVSEHWRLVIGVGFLGALTTFSTFGVETIDRFKDGEMIKAFLNIVLNVVLGLTAVLIGMWVAKSISGQTT